MYQSRWFNLAFNGLLELSGITRGPNKKYINIIKLCRNYLTVIWQNSYMGKGFRQVVDLKNQTLM